MIIDGRVVGLPLVDYAGDKADIEALTLTAADVGAWVYASDTKQWGVYGGAAWVWSLPGVWSDPHDLSEVNSIQFDLTPGVTPAEGQLCWDAVSQTLILGMPGGHVFLNIGQESIVRVKAAEDIADGEVVYVSGVTGSNLEVSLARADNPLTCHPRSIYVATEAISSGAHGYVARWGAVNGIPLSVDADGLALANNDVLYLSATVAGGKVKTAPGAPNILVKLGGVIKAHATEGIMSLSTYNGGILTDIREGWYLQNAGSAGRLWGGLITDAGSGTVDISAGAGVVKNDASDLETEPTAIDQGQGSGWTMVEWDAQAGFALAGVGYNLIYWDASAGAFAAQLKENFYANFDFTRDFTIGRVYYDGATVTIRICGMNLWNFSRRVQMFGEERFPVERATGMMISETGTRNIALTAGVLWAELVNRFSVSAFDSSGAGRFTYWYRDGLGGWTAVATQAQIDNTYWDDGTGTLNDLTANRYGVHWVYECHDAGVHVVYGWGDYTLAQAEQAGPPTTLPGLLGAYATLVGKIVVQKSAATFTSVQSPFTTQFAPGAVSDHNDLSGLQGGTTDQYYHLTSAEEAAATRLATTTQSGLAEELATVDETKAGADASRVVTPAGLAGVITLATPATDGKLTKAGAGVLTLSSAADYTLTVPATGTALLRTANVAAGRVLFGSDANTADGEDALFWDGANNRLGIGITTPDEELHVYQATGSTQIHVETGDTNVVAVRLTNSEGDWAVRCDDDALRFYDQGAALTRALLNSVGDMGIGETSPVAQLHVYQSSGSGTQPVLYLRQADVSEEAVYIYGTSSSITADQTLIKQSDFPTAGALLGWLKIVVQDSRAGGIGTVDAWLPFYAVPS